MRIDRLQLTNFKGFAQADFDFHPQFNLLTGENGSGKTTVLEALAVAAGGWFLGMRSRDTRPIGDDEVRMAENEKGVLEQYYPVRIVATDRSERLQAMGYEAGLTWRRELVSAGKRTTAKDAKLLKSIAAMHEISAEAGVPVTLPLIVHYGAGRLGAPVREAKTRRPAAGDLSPADSRLSGYDACLNPALQFPALHRWIAGGGDSAILAAVQHAVTICPSGCQSVAYDPAARTFLVDLMDGQRLPYPLLSAGQRALLGLIADLTVRIATLNPPLRGRALAETHGIVLIDEVDLHLHPRWQRQMARDLKRTFPKLQFFVSTNSPQIISETPADEVFLIRRDGTWCHPGHITTTGTLRLQSQVLASSPGNE